MEEERLGLEEKANEVIETKLKIEEDKIALIKKAISKVVEVFSPLLPFIIVYGILMTFQDLCMMIYAPDTLMQIFTLMIQCILSMIPFALLLCIAKAFETSEILAIVVGLSMTISAYYPNLNQIHHYNGQIMPALFAGLFLVFLEKTFKKYIQPSLVPIVSWVVCIVAVQVLLGPVASDINHGLANMLSWCFTSEARFIIAPTLVYITYFLAQKQWLALFIPLDLLMISEFGYTYLWPLIAISQFSFFAVAYFKSEDRKLKEFLYISKPVHLEEKTYIHYALITGAVASLFASYFSIRSYAIGLNGIIGIASMELSYFVAIYLLALLIAFLIPYYIMTNPAERKEIYQKMRAKFNRNKKELDKVIQEIVPEKEETNDTDKEVTQEKILLEDEKVEIKDETV